MAAIWLWAMASPQAIPASAAMQLDALSFPLSSSAFFYSSSNSKFRPPNAISQWGSLGSPTPYTIPSHPQSSSNATGVIIVGGGLAGLAAAIRLQDEKVPFILLESSDGVGGRVRTDFADGYVLDRGFQIFTTGYPEVRRLLDYDALDLRRFYSGAVVYYGGGFHKMPNPLRHFPDVLQSLGNPIGTVIDKLLIGFMIFKVLTLSDDEIFRGDEVTTVELLRRIGFSDSILDRFFRPFFGGIFFERNLETTSRLFNFAFKCLLLGDNTLPNNGISAVPQQLAGKLNPSSIKLNSRVLSIDYESGDDDDGIVVVKLENGDLLRSDFGVILAVEQMEAASILAGSKTQPKEVKLPFRSTICLYFSLDDDKVPIKDPVLFINGSGVGIVNNMFFPTNVAPGYAPCGKALASVSVIGVYDETPDNVLACEVLDELRDWFGDDSVRSWSYLRTYRIRYAEPNQTPPTDLMKDPRVSCGVFVCGDYVTNATFDGALVSGRRAVEALLKEKASVKMNRM